MFREYSAMTDDELRELYSKNLEMWDIAQQVLNIYMSERNSRRCSGFPATTGELVRRMNVAANTSTADPVELSRKYESLLADVAMIRTDLEEFRKPLQLYSYNIHPGPIYKDPWKLLHELESRIMDTSGKYILKDWRTKRDLAQEDLSAIDAEMKKRNISLFPSN